MFNMFKRKLLSKMGPEGFTVNQALKFNLITSPVPPSFTSNSYTPANNRGFFDHAFLPPKTTYSIMRESLGATTQTEQEPIEELKDVSVKKEMESKTTGTLAPTLTMHNGSSVAIKPTQNSLVTTLQQQIHTLEEELTIFQQNNFKLSKDIRLGKEHFWTMVEKEKAPLQQALDSFKLKLDTMEKQFNEQVSNKETELNNEKRLTHHLTTENEKLLRSEDIKLQELRTTNFELEKLHNTWNATVQRYVINMIEKIDDPDAKHLLENTPYVMVGKTKMYDQIAFQKIMAYILEGAPSEMQQKYVTAIDTFMTNAMSFKNNLQQVADKQTNTTTLLPGTKRAHTEDIDYFTDNKRKPPPDHGMRGPPSKRTSIRNANKPKPNYKETTNAKSKSRKGKSRK